MKAVGLFVLKSVGFSIIFWVVGGLLYFSLANIGQSRSADGNSANTAMTENYWSQAAETDALQEITKTQLAESGESLKKQAELLVRWEKIIERWERLPAKQP